MPCRMTWALHLQRAMLGAHKAFDRYKIGRARAAHFEGQGKRLAVHGAC